MRYAVKSAPLFNVSESHYRALLALTFGETRGELYRQSERERRVPRLRSRAFWIERDGRPVAWALSFITDTRRYYLPEGTHTVWMFTAPEYRRKGMGKQIFKKILAYYNTRPVVNPWDGVSQSFFDAIGAKNQIEI